MEQPQEQPPRRPKPKPAPAPAPQPSGPAAWKEVISAVQIPVLIVCLTVLVALGRMDLDLYVTVLVAAGLIKGAKTLQRQRGRKAPDTDGGGP